MPATTCAPSSAAATCGPRAYVWVAGLASSASLLAICLLLGLPLTGYPPSTYLWFAALALITQAFGYLAVGYALGHLPASVVSPTMVGQPVVTALLAIPLLSEPLSPTQIVGGSRGLDRHRDGASLAAGRQAARAGDRSAKRRLKRTGGRPATLGDILPAMDLFDHALRQRMKQESPLAARMRPLTLDDFVGQDHIVGPGRLLRRAIEADRLFSSILLWGPPGSGKTTLAMVIAQLHPRPFRDDLGRARRQGRAAPNHPGGARAAASLTTIAPSCSSTRSIAGTRPSRMRFCPMSRTARSP